MCCLVFEICCSNRKSECAQDMHDFITRLRFFASWRSPCGEGESDRPCMQLDDVRTLVRLSGPVRRGRILAHYTCSSVHRTGRLRTQHAFGTLLASAYPFKMLTAAAEITPERPTGWAGGFIGLKAVAATCISIANAPSCNTNCTL